MARGSLGEVETHIQIALKLDYLSDSEGSGLMEETAQLGRILNGLLGSLKKPACANRRTKSLFAGNRELRTELLHPLCRMCSTSPSCTM